MDNTRVNYSVPKYKLASIYQGLRRLAKLVRKLTFYLTITDRRIYGDCAIRLSLECLGEFIVAYDFQDERPHHYQALVAKFHQLQCVIDEINDENLVRRKPVEKGELDARKGTKALLMRPDSLMLSIYEEIGKIDNDISKWRQTVLRPQQVSTANP